MGKYTLMIVLAAIVGGSMLSLNQRRTARATGQDRADGQASLLARQIAESGQGVALAAATGELGFLDEASFFASFGTDPRGYNGGFYQADSFRSYDMGRRADLVVSGLYGPGASPARHVLASSYEFDPMDYPGPIWLDVPYATSSGGAGTKIDGAASIAGANVTLPTHFDQRKLNQINGSKPILSAATVQTALQGAAGGSPVRFSNNLKTVSKTSVNPALGSGNLLDDLNVDNAEDLYQAVLGAMGASDRTLTPAVAGGVYLVNSAVTWTGPTTVTHVDGSLTVSGSGGRVTGEGVLVVSGDLIVQTGGQLDWDGLVVARSDRDEMTVEFQGQARINGALVVNQEAIPQVGHLDMTVLKDPSGAWAAPWGIFGPVWGSTGPFYHHTHRFDDLPGVMPTPKQRVARFVHDGSAAPSQDAALYFQQTIDALGSDDIQLRFNNAGAHGHAVYAIDIAGEAPITGTVRTGFPETFSQGNGYTSQPFRASDLDAFTLDVRSLPALKRLWDTETPDCGQTQWPLCVGVDKKREGALTVQILRSGTPVYEAAMYWHVRVDEWADHQAKMAAWEADIVTNGSFGLDLDITRLDLDFDLPRIVRLSDRLGFDGNRVNHLGTTVRHIAPGAAQPAKVWYCHKKPGNSGFQSIHINPNAVEVHASHVGDYPGQCI